MPRRPKTNTWHQLADGPGDIAVFVANNDVATHLGRVNFVYTYRIRGGQSLLTCADWLTTPFLVTDSAWTRGLLIPWRGYDLQSVDTQSFPTVFSILMKRTYDCFLQLTVDQDCDFDAIDMIMFGDGLPETIEVASRDDAVKIEPATAERARYQHRDRSIKLLRSRGIEPIAPP